MKLSDLVKTVKPSFVECTGVDKDSDLQITSVHYRSQEVQPGGLFVAIAGHSVDGHDFIEDAIERGAVAIITQKQVSSDMPTVRVADTRQALADIAARFYENPSERLTVIGITGTNGKTTTAYLVESILDRKSVVSSSSSFSTISPLKLVRSLTPYRKYLGTSGFVFFHK